ncbi:FtsW/RodA/SpoVE family cell cycle protein [Pseudonocardia alni]|uniref:FtsW/RodA/SpoVE family cell cycle protein n=1 Tax=Pseudonocardia alni TaxID=33907 RepID=UPI00279B59C1|nr:FtsW/RodA/SpoVE family cell cycle protein [Pseudonocardia alni]
MLTWLVDQLLLRAAANLVVLAGLVVSAGVTARLLLRPGSAPAVAAAGAVLPRGPGGRGGAAQLVAGPALVTAGFLASGASDVAWSLIGVLLVALCAGLASWLLRVAHRDRGEDRVAPAALAVLGATSALAVTGVLLVVRLVVVPDPDAATSAIVEGPTVRTAVETLVLPFAVVAAVCAVLLLVRAGRLRVVRRGAAALLDRVTRRRRASTGRRWESTLLLEGLLLVAVLAPLVEGSPNLTVARIATPEYAKPLYLLVLAVLLANLAVLFHPPQGWRARERSTWRPIVPLAIVAFGSAARSDLGPLVPALAGMLAMYWSVLRAEARAAQLRSGAPDDAAGRRRVRREALAAGRPLLIPALGSLAALGLAVLAHPYIANRVRTWWEPWVYPWVSPCVPPPAGSAPPFEVPDGSVACQEALQTYVAGRLSQISQSLAAVADGGLWGRGLPDTITGRIPAGSTDFVLAVTWNKLGGLAVLALSVLVVLLGVALVTLYRDLRPGARAGDPGRLLAAGAAGMLVGQYLFVLAATLNVVPHSGITAPWLSRGGQSTLAVTLVVLLAVAAGYRGGRPPHPTRARPGRRCARRRPPRARWPWPPAS